MNWIEWKSYPFLKKKVELVIWEYYSTWEYFVRMNWLTGTRIVKQKQSNASFLSSFENVVLSKGLVVVSIYPPGFPEML